MDVPKYQSLVDWIKAQITAGDIAQGQRLYSENELSGKFSVSRQTVRQALNVLEHDGFVTRRRGSGTYARHPGQQPRARATVGVILTYLDDYIFPGIIRGISGRLTEDAFAMQVSTTENDPACEAKALHAMIEGDVGGLIVEPTRSGLPTPNLGLYCDIARRGLPCLFINGHYPAVPFPCVALDDQAAGALAAGYLLEKGHRAIAAIFKSDDIQGHLRYAGFANRLAAGGILLPDVAWYDTEGERTLFSGSEIAALVSRKTAVLCYNDQIATRLIEWCAANGLGVPTDISVMGIGNSAPAVLGGTPLCSIDHPKELLGRTAAGRLLTLMRDPAFDAQTLFKPHIVERRSVEPPSGKLVAEPQSCT